MKLTDYTNHARRTLQSAALRSPLVRVDDVVQVHGMARPHIIKIVHELGRAGYLQTIRSRCGGVRLGRPAGEIVVGAVVRPMEGALDVVECLNLDTNTWPLIGICKLSRALQSATRAFMAVLDDLMIADITPNRAQLLDRIVPLADEGLWPVTSTPDQRGGVR